MTFAQGTRMGRYATARTLYEEALTSCQQAGNTIGVVTSLCNLGNIAYSEDDQEAAREYYSEALTMAQDLEHKPYIALTLDGFGALAAKRGHLERAAQLAGAADRLRELVGYKLETTDRLFHDTYIANLRVALGEDALAATREQGRALKMKHAIALALEQTDQTRRTQS